LLKIYGKENGFGWKLNEVLGIRLATVPYEVSRARAIEEFMTFSVSLIAISLIILLVIYVVLQNLVMEPMAIVSDRAMRLADGRLDDEEFGASATKKDEISVLMRSMDRVQGRFC